MSRFLTALVPLLTAAGLVLVPAAARAGAPYSCVTTADNGTCGPYQDPGITGVGHDNQGNPNGTIEGNNVFGGVTQTFSANSPGDWMVAADAPAGQGGVASYPSLSADFHVQDAAGNWASQPLGNFGSITSSFAETMNATPGTIASAAYDIWLDGSPVNEVMIHHDLASRGGCDSWTAQGVTFGGSNGVPADSNWELCVPPGSTTAYWEVPDADSFSTGSVDILAMLRWLAGHGIIPASSALANIGYGWEICSTGGQQENFVVSGFTLAATAAGSGALAPAVTTGAASGVTASAATLNGAVNPEGQAATYKFDYGTTTGYGSSVPVPAGQAGAGTTAVNESSTLTGLTAGTTYHYRIEAANATGTTTGADQQFTTAASGGGGSVAYGATGPGSGGAKVHGASVLSWAQPVSGSGTALLAGVSVGGSNDTITVTDNGVPMTAETTRLWTDGQPGGGYLQVFGLVNPPAGVNTIKVTATGGWTPVEITGGSESFTGVSRASPFSAPVTAYGSGGTPSVTMAGTAAGDMTAGFAAAGSAITSAAAPSASRFIADLDGQTGAGNSAGATSAGTGSAVTMTWAAQPDWWSAAVVQVNHA